LGVAVRSNDCPRLQTVSPSGKGGTSHPRSGFLAGHPSGKSFPHPLRRKAQAVSSFPPHWWRRVRAAKPFHLHWWRRARADNFSPPHWWGRVRVGGKSVTSHPRSGFPDWQTVDWPAVPGRPIPLSLGKELGCGTRRRIGQGGFSRNGPRQLTGIDTPIRPFLLSDPASAASSDRLFLRERQNKSPVPAFRRKGW
jgi:hypothetical protein